MKLRSLFLCLLLVGSVASVGSVSAAQSGNQSTVTVTPATETPTVDRNESVTLSYEVDTGNESVYAYEVVLDYDTDKLDAETVTGESFLSSDGVETIDVASSVNESAGRVRIARSRTGDDPIAGAGSLFSVRFTGLAGGETAPVTVDTLFLDANGTEVRSTGREARLTVAQATDGGSGTSGDTDGPRRVDIHGPEAGQIDTELTFAGSTGGGTSLLERYQWSFDGNDTATGQRVNRSFAEPGNHTVALTAVEKDGTRVTETTTVTIAEPTANSDPQVAETTLETTELRRGENVTVTAALSNPAQAPQTAAVDLSANGTVVTSTTVDIAPNATAEATLSYAPADTGAFALTVHNESVGTVTVAEPTATPVSATDTATTDEAATELGGAFDLVPLAAVLLLSGIVVVVFVRRR